MVRGVTFGGRGLVRWGDLWWEGSYERGDLWWEGSYKRGDLWWEGPYKRETTVPVYKFNKILIHFFFLQIPGCEFNFDENNPPIHAWTCLKVFRMTGGTDFTFLANSYKKLLKNYQW